MSKEQKIAIVENEIAKHTQAIYTLTIQGRCAGALGNVKGVEAIQKSLEENTKAVSFYNEELEKIKKG